MSTVTKPSWHAPGISAHGKQQRRRPTSPEGSGRPGAAAHRLNETGCLAGSIRFPFNGFTYCLTLFSECFSSFPHGTCSLSVSCQYLALRGVYHAFWAAIPNSPTLRKRLVPRELQPRTGFSPSLICCSKQLGPDLHAGITSLETTIRRCKQRRFKS